MRNALVAVFILLLAACGQRDRMAYPPEAELNFNRACEAAGSPQGFCPCVWRRIQAEVPAADFIAYERLPINERAAHPLTEQITNYSLACAAEISAPDLEPAPAP